jgi:hypothetical protein
MTLIELGIVIAIRRLAENQHETNINNVQKLSKNSFSQPG